MGHSPKTSIEFARACRSAFCLTEVVVSLIILAIMSSSVLVVINRSMASASNMSLKAQAFAIARENMEQVLISPGVEKQTEYGRSEQFPAIQWETRIETFSPPIGVDTWVRAVCKATYEDAAGETQEVELVHWLTALTDSQLNALDAQNGAADGVLETAEEAAEYAGVDPDTIDLWLERGLVTTPEGRFITANLDLFVEAGGRPTEEELALQVSDVSMGFGEDKLGDWQDAGAPGVESDELMDAMMQQSTGRGR